MLRDGQCSTHTRLLIPQGHNTILLPFADHLTGIGAAWHLAQVEVWHPGNQKTYTFPCNDWLEHSKDKGAEGCKRTLKTGAAAAAGAQAMEALLQPNSLLHVHPPMHSITKKGTHTGCSHSLLSPSIMPYVPCLIIPSHNRGPGVLPSACQDQRPAWGRHRRRCVPGHLWR